MSPSRLNTPTIGAIVGNRESRTPAAATLPMLRHRPEWRSMLEEAAHMCECESDLEYQRWYAPQLIVMSAFACRIEPMEMTIIIVDCALRVCVCLSFLCTKQNTHTHFNFGRSFSSFNFTPLFFEISKHEQLFLSETYVTKMLFVVNCGSIDD